MIAQPPAVDIERIAPSGLLLDHTNPRLAGREVSIDDQAQILSVLWREFSVNEIVDSILASHFWQHEELLAEATDDGQLVVIEGNRRLAAVKVLVDPKLREEARIPAPPEPSPEVLASIERLPVIRCRRDQVWEYIGFKHVNGPQDWDSVAKAEYIARVHNDMNVPLDKIARTIGDRHDTVRRLYGGLMVLEQAEREGEFSRTDAAKKHFSFSHLWTGLGYPGIRTFLGIPGARIERVNPVPKKHLPQLGELCRWLYGSKSEELKPLVVSQNPHLKQLDDALQSMKGLAALRSGLPLDTAVKVALGDEELLRNSIVTAEAKLREAKGYFPNGFSGQSDIEDSIRSIQKLANSLASEADGYIPPKKKKRG